MDSNKLKVAKSATKLVVYRSVGFVVASAIANLVPTETKTQKIELIVGSNVIGAIVADKGSDWVDKKFVEAADAYTRLKKHMEKTDQ